MGDTLAAVRPLRIRVEIYPSDGRRLPVSLNIKNDETEQLARELAAATGENVTGAITVVLRERLARLKGHDGRQTAERLELIRAISRDAAGRWVEPYGSMPHADLLYDELGLPR